MIRCSAWKHAVLRPARHLARRPRLPLQHAWACDGVLVGYRPSAFASKAPDKSQIQATSYDGAEALVSWIDPFDMPMDEPPRKKVPAASSSSTTSTPPPKAPTPGQSDTLPGLLQKLELGSEVEGALAKLGVRTVSDLRLLGDQDLIKGGIPVVATRKLLKERSSGAAAAAEASVPKHVGAMTFSAQDTMKNLAKTGIASAERKAGQIFCSSFLGGAFLGFGGALTVVVAGGSSAALAEVPGLLALLAGAVFPVGLSMVILSGSEILTGNFMTMSLPAFTHPGVSTQRVVSNFLKVWGVSGLGNLTGALFLACMLYSLSIVTPDSPAGAWLAALTVAKCSLPPLAAVGKGICANWLVNVAIFQAQSAHTSAGKIASLWLPIMTFVTLGLEHSVANMFLLPFGMFVGADVDVLAIIGNLLPVAVGNALGAVVFVAGVQRYALIRNLVYSKPV